MDGDGLDDAWEIFYFGNVTAQDSSGDPNGDGIPNSQEQVQGTTPGILPAIKSAGFVAGGGYVIDFTGNPNTTYQVRKSTTLAAFETLTPALTATTDGDGVGVVTVPGVQADGPAGFYRLEIP